MSKSNCKTFFSLALTSVSALFCFPACVEVNPYTERSQIFLISEAKEIKMGQEAFQEILDDPEIVLSQDPNEIIPFQRVFEKLVVAAKESKFSERAKNLDWEMKVIKDENQVDGFSLPGGKVAFYTGFLSLGHL